MEDIPRPVVRGIFFNSHVESVRRLLGEDGVIELERRLGYPLRYTNTDLVPVADEIAMLEQVVDMISGVHLSKTDRALEAGRLHFRDFQATRLWRMLALLPRIMGLKFLLMRSRSIAEYVFRNIVFIPESTGSKRVKITFFNNDYPLEHFQGFFQECLSSLGYQAIVDAADKTRGRYEYTISWF